MRTGVDDGQNKRKSLAYRVVAIIVEALMLVLLLVLLLRVRTPKFRLRSVSVETLSVKSSSNPSFSLKLNARVTVKNTNFGHYKFDETKIIVSYRGTEVGGAAVFKSRAKLRSTKKFNVTMGLDSNKISSNSLFGSDLNSNNLTFNAHANLKGKVYLLQVFKKKKSAEMNCTFVVDTSRKIINDLSCK